MMFLPTKHVRRLIVSASFALVVVLPAASTGAVASHELAAPLFRFAAAFDSRLLASAGAARIFEQQTQAGATIAEPLGAGGIAPIPQTDLKELAFVRDDQIFRIRLDGTGPVQLTSDGMNSEPAWSPDGERIAFVRSGDIYVMNADGSNIVRRTDGGINVSPAWSPDGTRIAFSSVRDGNLAIYVMRVDEDWWNPQHLGFDRGWDPAWSPDGRRIAFVSDWRAYDFLFDLYVMNADGSDDPRLLLGGPFPDSGTYYFQPAWSPDGSTIALTVCPEAWDNCFPDSAVALVNADGSRLRTIARAGGFARPNWSPDGIYVAFGSSACRECQSDIRCVTANGSSDSSSVLVSNARSPTWRP